MEEHPSYDESDGENGRYYTFRHHRTHSNTCPRSPGRKMTLIRRYLVLLFLQFGCLALDNTAHEISYEEDDIQLIMGHEFPGDHMRFVNGDNKNLGCYGSGNLQSSSENSVLSFHPKSLNFKECPVGIPRLGVVRVDNRLKNENLKLISISGNTVHFHSSFFADKIISPGGNTTFDVVFLGRSEGLVDSSLYIHTSKGMFKYHVHGYGSPNPYRLRPLVGARIPVNGSYEPLITMHNPHNSKIQIVEMLSSGSEFQLALPDGMTDDGEAAAWAIEPYQTKPVMKASFQAKSEGNHSGYVKIRVNSTKVSSEYLYVPVEVQVSLEALVYSPQDSLDFGILLQSDKAKTLSLLLINAQKSPVNIQSVFVRGGRNPAVRIEFRPVVLDSDSVSSTVVALVTFEPSEVSSMKQTHGFIEMRSECGQSISIPFSATVLQGDLVYNVSALGFFSKSENLQARNFSLKNNFSFPVAVHEVNVSHPDVVQITNFNNSIVLAPGEQKVVLTLKVSRKSNLCDSKAGIQILLKTNVTNLRLPVTCYDGKLRVYTGDMPVLDFGRIEVLTSQTEYFSVENKNPVEIRLKSWGSNSSLAFVELVGMQQGGKELLGTTTDVDSLKKSLFLQPGYMAIFSVDVKRPLVEGNFYGEAYVSTDHDQSMRIPFHFSVAKGSVTSDIVKFDKTFPGKISFEKLYLSSSFNQTLNLKSVHTGSSNLMWFSPASVQDNREILSGRKNYVGKVYFDPRKACGQHCYCGFTLDTEMGKMWAQGMNADLTTYDGDRTIHSTLQRRYESVKQLTLVNTSLWVETNEFHGYKVRTQISFSWPRLISSKAITFPLTALMNETVIEIPVSNPSSFPIFVHALLANQYGPSYTDFVSKAYHSNMSLDSEAFSLDGVSVLKLLGVKNTAGLLFMVQPGAKYLIKAKFRPTTTDPMSIALLLRNNLTGIETTILRGRAGTGQLTLGNGMSGSSLLFQLTEKLLQGCKSAHTSKYVPPQLTVRRSFIARNIGEIPVEIRNLEISSTKMSGLSAAVVGLSGSLDACEGYGFRILNCYPFTIFPNQTHSIDIAFTPDFTMTRVIRSLRLTDSFGAQFNYSLVAMVPSGMLGVCAAIINRPSWEPVLKYLLGAGIILSMIAASLMAYFEAGSVVSTAVVATVRVIPDDSRGLTKESKEGQKFDLKAVYDKVGNRFKRNQSQSPSTSDSHTVQQSVIQDSHAKTSLSLTDFKDSLAPVSTVRQRKKKVLNEVSSQSSDVSIGQHKLSKSLNAINGSVSKSSVGAPPSQGDEAGCTTQTFLVTNSTAGSKKTAEILKKKKTTSAVQNTSSGRKDSKSSIINLPALPKLPNGTTKQNEEETSSTTTEGSNPDDVMMAVMMARCDEELRDKDRSFKNGLPDANKRNANSKDSRTSMKESGNSSAGDADEMPKRKNKQHLEPKRVSSPSMYDIPSWEPKLSTGDINLNEISTQMQEYGRLGKRDSVNNIYPVSNGSGGHNHTYPATSSPTNFPTTAMNRNASRNQQAGVIGQTRPLLHNQLQSQTNPFLSALITSTIAMTTPVNTGPTLHSSRQMNYQQQRKGTPAWSNDAMPDNTSDTWSKHNALDQHNFTSAYVNQRHELPTSQYATSSSYHTHPNGYGVRGTKSNGQPNLTHFSSQPPVSRAKTSPTPKDSSFLFAAPTAAPDLGLDLNNIWPAYSTYDANNRSLESSRYMPAMANVPVTQHQQPSPPEQQSLLHRLRTDVPTRRGYSPGGDSWSSAAGILGTGSELKENIDGSMAQWPVAPTPAVSSTSMFNTWTSHKVDVSSASDLSTASNLLDSGSRDVWDSTRASGSKWAFAKTNTDTSTFQTATPSLAHVNTNTTLDTPANPGEFGFAGRLNDVVQSQREVEAGLGFNPFTSDIWNQNQADSRSPSWSPSFRYGSNTE